MSESVWLIPIIINGLFGLGIGIWIGYKWEKLEKVGCE